MEIFSKQLRDNIRWEFRKEIEELKDEMRFKERDWKKETNELKERIKKLEINWEHYNNNRQNNVRQLEQENNTRNRITSSLTSTLGSSQPQSIRPTTYSRTESTRDNDNLTAEPSGISKNVQSHNSNVSKPSGSNRSNVANTVSDIRENYAFRVTSDDKSANKSNQSAPGNSRNVNNTDDDSAKIMCHCRKPAIQIIKKEGSYKDRPYYKCAYSNDKPYGSRCEFFLPVSDSAIRGNTTNEYSNSVSNMDRNNAGVGTSNNNSLTAQADPNKGQSFGVRRTVNFNNSHVYSRTNRSNSNFFKRPKLT